MREREQERGYIGKVKGKGEKRSTTKSYFRSKIINAMLKSFADFLLRTFV